MMRNSSLLVLEIIWITTGILCTGAALRLAFKGGNGRIIIFALMALLSFVFAWIRHNQRKKN